MFHKITQSKLGLALSMLDGIKLMDEHISALIQAGEMQDLGHYQTRRNSQLAEYRRVCNELAYDLVNAIQ